MTTPGPAPPSVVTHDATADPPATRGRRPRCPSPPLPPAALVAGAVAAVAGPGASVAGGPSVAGAGPPVAGTEPAVPGVGHQPARGRPPAGRMRPVRRRGRGVQHQPAGAAMGHHGGRPLRPGGPRRAAGWPARTPDRRRGQPGGGGDRAADLDGLDRAGAAGSRRGHPLGRAVPARRHALSGRPHPGHGPQPVRLQPLPASIGRVRGPARPFRRRPAHRSAAVVRGGVRTRVRGHAGPERCAAALAVDGGGHRLAPHRVPAYHGRRRPARTGPDLYRPGPAADRPGTAAGAADHRGRPGPGPGRGHEGHRVARAGGRPGPGGERATASAPRAGWRWPRSPCR